MAAAQGGRVLLALEARDLMTDAILGEKNFNWNAKSNSNYE